MKPFLLSTLVSVLLLSIIYSCHQKTANTVVSIPDSSHIDRGRYLVETVGSCMHCHSQRDFSKFSGPIKEETKGMGGVGYPKFGVLYSSNITPDSATGIGSWTDDEIARAIALGIRRNGDTLFPIMPYYEYNKMSKEDIYSIVAYLRTLKPISNKIPERKLKTPAGPEHDLFTYSAIGENHNPSANDTVLTGKYLAHIGACVSCHTPKTEDDHLIEDSSYAGGDVMGQKFGFHVTSPNITPDKESGIGTWSQASFLSVFSSFRQPSGPDFYEPGKRNTIMPWLMLSQMKDEDIKAIYTYLRSVKPIMHPVVKWKEGAKP